MAGYDSELNDDIQSLFTWTQSTSEDSEAEQLVTNDNEEGRIPQLSVRRLPSLEKPANGAGCHSDDEKRTITVAERPKDRQPLSLEDMIQIETSASIQQHQEHTNAQVLSAAPMTRSKDKKPLRKGDILPPTRVSTNCYRGMELAMEESPEGSMKGKRNTDLGNSC